MSDTGTVGRADWAPLAAAMTHLSSVCDWAQERDGAGFSSADAALGHFLGSLPVEDWTLDDAITASVFATKYQRQLDITSGRDLLDSNTANRIDDERRQRARRAVRERAAARRAQARAQERKKSFAAKCSLTVIDDEVHFTTPYNAELVDAQRRIPGRRFTGTTNVYPLSSLPEIVDLCTYFAIGVPDDIAALADDITANKDAYAPVHVTVDDDGTLVITTDFNDDLNQGLRRINGERTWDSSRRVHRIAATTDAAALAELFARHDLNLSETATATLDAARVAQDAAPNGTLTVVGEHLHFDHVRSDQRSAVRTEVIARAGGLQRPGYGDAIPPIPLHLAPAAMLAIADEFGLSVSDEVRAQITDMITAQDAAFDASVAADGPPVTIDGLGITLMPHQHHAVAFLAEHKRTILADDMGLGKTVESIAALANSGHTPFVVACKPDLTNNWVREISATLPAARVFVAKGLTPTPIPADTDIVVIGFAALRAKATNPTVTLPPIDSDADEHAENSVQRCEHITEQQRADVAKALATAHAQCQPATDDVVVALAATPADTLAWTRALSAQLPDWSISSSVSTSATPDVIVTTKDQKSFVRKTPRFSWVEQLLSWQPRGFIVDEGQYGKEASAAQSQAMAQVGRFVADHDGMVLDLTGTPLINRPRELAQQLVILGHLAPDGESDPDGRYLFGEFKGFLFRYCGPEEVPGYGWTFNGASHLHELHVRLRRCGIYLRRRQSILTDLPECTQHELILEPSELDPVAWELYRRTENDVVSSFRDEAHAIAERLGVDLTDDRVYAAMKGNSEHHLARLNSLRQLLGAAKAPAISAWIAQQVDKGEKVMVAAHHRDVVSRFADEFGGLKIQGNQSVESKEADKLAFQTLATAQAPVISVSIAAGGVGHTLTASRLGIQAEQCWTPGEGSQMEKRIHRIGQTRPVDYYVALVPGTIDMYMWTMTRNKQTVLDAVLDGVEVSDTMDIVDSDRSGATAVAFELATAR